MTGWRIGWLAGPKDLVSAVGRLQSQSTSAPTSIAEHAAVAALTGPRDAVDAMIEEFDRRRRYMIERLEAIEGVRLVRPQGAFYVFPDFSAHYERLLGPDAPEPRSLAFADAVLERAKVAVVPGVAFGDDACCRLSFATSMEEIEKGLDRLEALLTG